MTARRHLLVLATQCRSMPVLTGLESVARELCDVLVDASLGGCEPGLPDGRSLIAEPQSGEEIRRAVRAAIAHAAERRATLVLALLGHGFVPGEAPTLYFMGADAREGVRDSAVNVPDLLTEAADRDAVEGVVGIIDTCHAAGAQPHLGDISTGSRGGRTAYALLMSAAVGQEAYELRFSRETAALLRNGSAELGPLVYADALKAALESRIAGQDIVSLTYAGERGAHRSVWVSANPAHAGQAHSGELGRYGAEELSAVLAGLVGPPAASGPWDEDRLLGLRRELVGETWDPARARAVSVIDNLVIAVRTMGFLHRWMGSGLTTRHLRLAAAGLRTGAAVGAPRIPPHLFRRDDSVVAYLALQYPNSHASCREWMCRFVVGLAQQAQRDLDAPELIAWANSIDGLIAFNDAVEAARRLDFERRLRLIVSLHASLAGDWPQTLDAWLLDGGKLLEHRVLDGRPEQSGTEEALTEAVDWAESLAADLGAPLNRVEVAVPGALLVRWRPEEVAAGVRLGADYEVVTRWSLRLNPPAGLKWINRHAVKHWERIHACVDATPVDWLAPPSTRDLGTLHQHLLSNRYGRAIGLDHLPDLDGDLLELLLAFSPVVLWPQTDAGFPAEAQKRFGPHWDALPAGFVHAYRKRWSNEAAEVVADLRAVWDDLEWLDFCRSPRRSPHSADRSAL